MHEPNVRRQGSILHVLVAHTTTPDSEPAAGRVVSFGRMLPACSGEVVDPPQVSRQSVLPDARRAFWTPHESPLTLRHRLVLTSGREI